MAAKRTGEIITYPYFGKAHTPNGCGYGGVVNRIIVLFRQPWVSKV